MTTTSPNKATQVLLDWLEFLIDTYIEDGDLEFFSEVSNLYRQSSSLTVFAGAFCDRYKDETEVYPFPSPQERKGADWFICGEFIYSKMSDRI